MNAKAVDGAAGCRRLWSRALTEQGAADGPAQRGELRHLERWEQFGNGTGRRDRKRAAGIVEPSMRRRRWSLILEKRSSGWTEVVSVQPTTRLERLQDCPSGGLIFAEAPGRRSRRVFPRAAKNPGMNWVVVSLRRWRSASLLPAATVSIRRWNASQFVQCRLLPARGNPARSPH